MNDRPEMNHRRALLILGMHRSGTSALTRVLNLRGATLPENLLLPNASNISGYWEPAEVVTLHDELLDAAGSGWSDPTEFPATWLETEVGQGYVRRISDVVTAEYGDSPLIVMKDPRACRLVPAWTRALARLGIEPLAVLIVRNPLEVAASLHRRDGMPQAQALLLWLLHQLAAEAATRSLKRVIVTYDQVLDHSEGVIARIDRQFGLRLAGESPETHGEIGAFLDRSLRHERASEADLESRPEVSPWVRQVYRWYQRASEHDGTADADELDLVHEEVRRADVVYAPLLRWYEWLSAGQQQRTLELERSHIVAEEARVRDTVLWQTRNEESEARNRDLEGRLRAHEEQFQAGLREAHEAQDALRHQIRMMESSWFWRLRARVKLLLGR